MKTFEVGNNFEKLKNPSLNLVNQASMERFGEKGKGEEERMGRSTSPFSCYCC